MATDTATLDIIDAASQPEGQETFPQTGRQALGSVFLPGTPGTPVGEYRFVLDRDSGEDVVIGTPVTADTVEGAVIGVVTDIVTVGPDQDPLQADFTHSNSAFTPVAAPTDVLVATVQVFHSERMRPVRAGQVRPATREEMWTATGRDNIEWPIPVGVLPLADGTMTPIYGDGHTLLGPEAGHITYGGLSGQAAKTSAAGVLMRSAVHAGGWKDELGNLHDTVGAIIFNVKGQDLVGLDEAPASGYELSDADLAMYDAMGVPPDPFDDVTVYAPALPGGGGTRSSKTTAEVLRWDLSMIWRYLRFFSPGLYKNDNMMAFLGDFENLKLRAERSHDRITSFSEFEAWMESEISQCEDNEQSTGWRNHHVATLRRARKLIMSLPERCGGLLAGGSAKDGDDVPVEHWRHGQVTVVDIAGLEPIVQGAVIARTCSRLLDASEKGALGVDHLMLFADELNMFAPKDQAEMGPVKATLRKISATGRYAGMSLIGAAQFLSAVDPQILGNAATRVCGIVSETELDTGVYGRLPAGQRERLLTMPKGQIAVKAYNLRGMLTVSFPRPAWRTGKAKVSRAMSRPAAAVLGMTGGSASALTEGVPGDVVEKVLARSDGDRAEAVAQLEKLRTPDMRRVSVERGSTYDPDDPWDLD